MRIRLVVLMAGVSVLLTAPGAAAADFSDPAGDAGSAPDITAVSVTTTEADVTFRVSVPSTPILARDAELFLAIDADPRAGDQHGVDFVYSLRGELPLRTRRWSGNQHVVFPSNATGRYESGVATFVVPRAELGDAAEIGFGAVGSRGADSDAAPGSGDWSLRLRAAPRVTSVVVRFAPAAPRAGRPFRVAVASARLSDRTAGRGTVTCTARIAGMRLAGRGCSWRIPAAMRGRRLTVIVRIAVPGSGAKARSFAFRIG
jgi:hypothetical protein